jgi:hypothetical protein
VPESRDHSRSIMRLARQVGVAVAGLALLVPVSASLRPAAAAPGCTINLSQQLVAGNSLGRMTVSVSAATPQLNCGLTGISGSVASATGVASVYPPGFCTSTTTGTPTVYGFKCQHLGHITLFGVKIVYQGRAGAAATSNIAATATDGTIVSRSATGAFDPAALAVTHTVGGTPGTGTDTVSLTNTGSVNLATVSITDTINAGTLTGLGIGTNRLAKCSKNATGQWVCTLTNPLPPNGTWRLTFHLKGHAGATDTNTAAAAFNFLSGAKTVQGQNNATSTGPLAP